MRPTKPGPIPMPEPPPEPTMAEMREALAEHYDRIAETTTMPGGAEYASAIAENFRQPTIFERFMAEREG